jgi:hypothetical protein
MSTKINARSPFFIESVEPTVSLGIFDCDTANLLNFAVSSDGDVTEPSILNGTIIDRTDTSFAANTSGSAISRSVTYTIQIPSGYSNTSDGTIDCVQTVDQPTQTSAEDPNQNNNCPTFSGTISAITNLTSTTVNLASFFTAGSGATISGYSVQNYGAAAISTSISGDTLTISTASECASTTLRVTAFNSSDACTAVSNVFSVSSSCTAALTCTDVNLTGGNISATGVISNPSYSIAHLDHIEDSGNNTITSVPANNGSSAISVTLTFVFTVPAGYTNAGAELECTPPSFSQPTTAAPKVNLECSDATFSGFTITPQGNIIAGTVSYLGNTGVTPNNITTESGEYKYDPVSASTSRTISVTFRVLNTAWLNYLQSITCTVNLTQPPSQNACDFVSGDYAISHQGFSAVNSFCDGGARYSILRQVNGTPAVGNTVCYLGSPYNGSSLFYAYASAQSQNGAGNIGTSFSVMQIDSSGTILRITTTNCQGDDGGDIQF